MKLTAYIDQLEDKPTRELALFLRENSGPFDIGPLDKVKMKELINGLPKDSKDLELLVEYFWCAEVMEVMNEIGGIKKKSAKP